VTALDMLAEVLANGPKPAAEVIGAMRAAGYTRHAIEVAKKRLRVRSRKLTGSYPAPFVWETPAHWCCPYCKRPWADGYTPPPPVQPVGRDIGYYENGEYHAGDDTEQEQRQAEGGEDTHEPLEEPPVQQAFVSRQRIGLCNVCGAPGEPGDRCTHPIRGLGAGRCPGLYW
jgi:hypothetical protein